MKNAYADLGKVLAHFGCTFDDVIVLPESALTMPGLQRGFFLVLESEEGNELGALMRRRDLLQLTAALSARCFLPPQSSQQVAARPSLPAKPSQVVKARVVVIGAGISGLESARRLVSEYGLGGVDEVIVLEARGRIGGRIRTDTSLAAPVELGANWIHGSTGNPLTALAAQFGAATSTVSGSSSLFDIDGSAVPSALQSTAWQQFLDSYNTASAYISGLTVDQSLEQSFVDTGAGAGLSGKALRVFERWQGEIETGLAAYNSQLSSFHHFMGSSFPGPDKLLPGGYSQIVAGVAQGLDVRLGHVVEEIDSTAARVMIHTDRGTFAAEKCIVTLPLGVLKAGLVSFRPSLPTYLLDAIGRMGFGAAFKLVMEFPVTFWNPGTTYLSYISPQPGESTDWRNLGEGSGLPILSTWTYQDYARALEALTVEEATARVMQDLRTIYGAGTPDPTKVVATDWNTSPYTQGSYSFAAVGSTPADHDQFLLPVDDKLYFAGEHTSSVYPSTVHGALLSGRDAAARVMGLRAVTSVPARGLVPQPFGRRARVR